MIEYEDIFFFFYLFLFIKGKLSMSRGDKSSYSAKQKRQAKHIEDSEKKQGRSDKAAKRIAWATVNKLTGGAAKKERKSKKRALQ